MLTTLTGRPVELLPCPPSEQFTMEPARIQLRHGEHLALEDAALILGITVHTLRMWIAHRTIGRVLIDRHAYVPITEVERMLKMRRSQVAPRQSRGSSRKSAPAPAGD